MSKKNPGRIDCACVIHGNGYDWQYVERLYNMLCRNLAAEVQLHVYTEHDRSVPPHMVKHILDDWGISGPKRSWWYKMQLFNPAHFTGNLLYFDLDVVIANQLDWVRELSTEYLWTIRDFRYLQRRDSVTMNSSMMWFNATKFSWVWDKFSQEDFKTIIKSYPGDQDYLGAVLSVNQRRFADDFRFESFRWQCLDGGYDFAKRKHIKPNTGVKIQPDTSVVVFHGNPKPAQVHDPVIQQLWQ
jgi:hypothetical protein